MTDLPESLGDASIPTGTPAIQRRIALPDLWIGLALAAIAFATYAQVLHLDFISLDDPDSVTLNRYVHGGFSLENTRWAFTSTDTNWFPLTRLSHTLDYRLFHTNAGGHHLTSLLFHIAASLMLFAFLRRATRARWPSAFVAFVFALHPLHVESVAWVSERKDVMCAFFWFLTLWIWAGYIRRPSRGRYLLALLAFALGLMSKPMIVTLPFVLLLLDRWPFGRPLSRKLVLEKIPFFILAVANSAITVVAQREGGAVQSLSAMPLALRVENSLVSWAMYVFQTFWPVDLAIVYPFPSSVPLWQAVAAALAIVAVSAVVLRFRGRCPFLPTGWFWYLGTLVPVIGLVQVGEQARADRYMYVPMVGLGIVCAWGAAWFLERRPRLIPAAAVLAATLCAALAVTTWRQVRYWQDSETVFGHAARCVDSNWSAHYNLAVYLGGNSDRFPDAIRHYRAALRIKPDFAVGRSQMARILLKMNRRDEAISEYRAALQSAPRLALAESGLGVALAEIPGRLPEALGHLTAAIAIDPRYAAGHYNLGTVYLRNGRRWDAIHSFETALEISPDYAAAHNALGAALTHEPGFASEAIDHLRKALMIDPLFSEAHNNLALALIDQPDGLPEAIRHLNLVLRLEPLYPGAHNTLGGALMKIPGRMPDAVEEFETAVKISPDYTLARWNLGMALKQIPGREAEAIAQLEAVQRAAPSPALRKMLDEMERANPGASRQAP